MLRSGIKRLPGLVRSINRDQIESVSIASTRPSETGLSVTADITKQTASRSLTPMAGTCARSGRSQQHRIQMRILPCIPKSLLRPPYKQDARRRAPCLIRSSDQALQPLLQSDLADNTSALNSMLRMWKWHTNELRRLCKRQPHQPQDFLRPNACVGDKRRNRRAAPALWRWPAQA